MAIIISSKNIYEINNQKVVDNEIDNIEVNAKGINQGIKYNTEVYNESIFSFLSDSYESQYQAKSSRENLSKLETSIAYIKIDETRFAEKEILIPVKSGNSRITNLRLGTSDGKPNIKSVVYCRYETGTARWGGTLIYNLVGWSAGNIQPEQVEIQIKKFGDRRDDYVEYDIIGSPIDGQQISIPQDKKVSYEYNPNNLAGTTKVEFYPKIFGKTNLANINSAEKITKNGVEYYKISVGIASGYRVAKLGGKDSYTVSGTMIDQRTWERITSMDGTYEYYFPQSIEITINGDVLTIDIQDETVKVGNGQHVYSFDGNELMQTSNQYMKKYMVGVGDFVRNNGEGFSVYSIVGSTPPLQDGDVLIYNGESAECISSEPPLISVKNGGEWASMSNVLVYFTCYKAENQIEIYYNNIIKDWDNGKEVAVIKCGIVDYFRIAQSTHYIDVSVKKNLGLHKCSITGSSDRAFSSIENFVSASIRINGQDYEIHNLTLANENTTLTGEIDLYFSDFDLGEYVVMYNYKSLAISPQNNSYPTTIHIGDIVIPYIKSPDGNDKPMSYYADKATPKEFLVIGKGIMADGEIMQELTLQETKQEE